VAAEAKEGIEEAILGAEAEEGTKEAIEDKDKSNHRSIGSNNIDEGSDNNSDEIATVVWRDCGGSSCEILTAAPTRF